MPEQRHFPTSRLGERYMFFLTEWGVSNVGLFLPPADGKQGVFIWKGNFILGDTVTIVADQESADDLGEAKLAIGVVRQRDYEQQMAVGNPLEVYADAATVWTHNGMKGAVAGLDNLRGLPNGVRLGLPMEDPRVHF